MCLHSFHESSAPAPWWKKASIVTGLAAVAVVCAQIIRKKIEIRKSKYNHFVYEGIVYPPFIHQGAVDSLRKDFSLRPDDIVIATFPKCGTTWMQQIVLLLLNDGDRDKVTDPMKQSPWLELQASLHARDSEQGMSLQHINSMSTTERRVWKTHACHHLAPWKHGTEGASDIAKGPKIIVVCRNAFDAVVSMYHHALDVPLFEYTGSFNHFFGLYRRGQVESGSYWRWYQGWWSVYTSASSRNNGSVLWVNFENLKADLETEIKTIAKFLGISCPDELAKKVAMNSTFSSMKKQFADLEKVKLAKGEKVKKNHIRQGKVGGWKAYFSKEQTQIFVEKEMRHHATVPAYKL